MNIPESAIEPFGVIGMPRLRSKEQTENALLGVIREIAERIDRENAARAREWFNDPRIRDMLNAIEKDRS